HCNWLRGPRGRHTPGIEVDVGDHERGANRSALWKSAGKDSLALARHATHVSGLLLNPQIWREFFAFACGRPEDAKQRRANATPRDTNMANKMLIDATHPEETRVVVLRGNRVEEFDFESASRRQLRGNIYLAKVTRVEPSLQAAFVDYGGNRHGFLAFSEIHPDYYQIPV